MRMGAVPKVEISLAAPWESSAGTKRRTRGAVMVETALAMTGSAGQDMMYDCVMKLDLVT